MKKIFLLAALASTSLSSVAMASFCANQPTYSVTVGGTPLGEASFKPSSVVDAGYSTVHVPQTLCGYAMDWKNPAADGTISSASCNVAQLNIVDQDACAGGRKSPGNLDGPLLSAAGCRGFDPSGQEQTLSIMISSDDPGCGMNGLATYSFYPYAIQVITFD